MSVVLITVELILIFWIRLFCWEVGPFHIYSCLWFLLSVLSCYWEVGQLLVIFICEFLWCIYNILLVRSGTIHYLFLLWYLSLVQMVYDFAWLHSIRYFTLCSPFLNEGRSVTNIGMQLCAQLGFMNVCLYLWDCRRDDVTWQRGRLVTWCFGVDLAPNLISWECNHREWRSSWQLVPIYRRRRLVPSLVTRHHHLMDTLQLTCVKRAVALDALWFTF